eukprot:GHRQ01005858.1.p1 GENE.GHRQ01005858.1~~GHRQ01005858.1.p1  ORF type:complete len:103 (+),score=2.81 GHRQ01005858.1:253-561(+)
MAGIAVNKLELKQHSFICFWVGMKELRSYCATFKHLAFVCAAQQEVYMLNAAKSAGAFCAHPSMSMARLLLCASVPVPVLAFAFFRGLAHLYSCCMRCKAKQ